MRSVVALAFAVVFVAACGSSAPSRRSTGTVWLCRPGRRPDPCTSDLTATVVPAHGPRNVQHMPAGSPSFDCFYIYPTVSTESGDNADLRVQPAERAAAVAQASRFAPLCRVWAPMYRQRTEASLLKGLGSDPAADRIAYASVLAAWRDYLAHDNDGRPVIFIGHSQGAAMLIRLLAAVVDPGAALRARVVLAILAGGNVAVPAGKVVGATFRHLPLCTAAGEDGCVVAYSSFPAQPPAASPFGRPGRGVSLQSGQTATRGVQIGCVNPAAIGGGTVPLLPYFLAATAQPSPSVSTPWVSYPGRYTASCRTGGGASWLQVSHGAPDARPVVGEPLGAAWGYHLDDVNLALGNLTADVRAAERTYTRAH